MTFELPDNSPTTSLALRELEQTAPNVTPKAIRAALVKAAAELEMHERRRDGAVAILVEAQGLRVGAMDSASRVHEIGQKITRALDQAVAVLSR